VSGRSRSSAPRILARAIGYGALCGLALGIASVVVLVVPLALLANDPAGIGDVVIFAPVAGIVGGVIGLFVGLFGGVALIVTGATDPGNEGLARPVAAVAAAAPFLALVAAALADGPGAPVWETGSWLWLLVVALMAAATGAFVGPRVVRLERDRRPAAPNNRPPRTLLRCTLLRCTALRRTVLP
jgi:hypothetical protein